MMTKFSIQTTTPSDGALAASLAAQGVRHLRIPAVGQSLSLLPPDVLIASLAYHAEPCFRDALIPLFLRHPEYAGYAPGLAANFEPTAALTLRHLYTAAVYLQRLWLGTLGLYLGKFLLLPDYFGQQAFDLPTPEEHFGEAGLRRLAKLFQEKTGYNWLSTYHTVMALFLTQLRLEHGRNDE